MDTVSPSWRCARIWEQHIPGSQRLYVKTGVPPEALSELVLVPSVRGAPLAVAAGDLAVFTAGLAPPDAEAARVVVGNAWKTLETITPIEALDRVSDAVRESLSSGPLPRDDFHQTLRERLPKELLWWCRGCGSHHVHPVAMARDRDPRRAGDRRSRGTHRGVRRAAPGSGGRRPGTEPARRFLRAYGPARPKLLADWAGRHADRGDDSPPPIHTEVGLVQFRREA